MELHLKVRRAHFEQGLSGRQIARDLGISRDSVRKMPTCSEPPGYRRTAPIRRPELDRFADQIDQWLAEDRGRPRKQRHTAKRILERLRDECGFGGGATIVKDHVRASRRSGKEMLVPLNHPPGHAQADLGEAVVVIGGVEQKAFFFALDLPHGDACHVRACPAATTEAWLDGHVHALAFLGAVPRSIPCDNDRCLVARIMADGARQGTRRFSALLSHHVIDDRHGRPGKGNDKGKVEGLVGHARRNFMVPLPCLADWSTFDTWLEEQCCRRQGNVPRGRKISIGERLNADPVAMRALPAAPFEACDVQGGQVTSTSMVRHRGNDCSVPVAHGHRDVWIKGLVDRIVIGCATDVIANHARSHDSGDMVFDPVHHLAPIERRIMAFDQAAPLQDWDLPEALITLQRLLEARQGKAGKREHVQVLRLLERLEFDVLHLAIRDALQMQAISLDAIKHLLPCRIERRPPRLDLNVCPFLPRTNIATTSAASHMSLPGGGGA